jgi:transposase
VERARVVLRAADGQATAEIGRDLGIHVNTVAKWRRRFRERRDQNPEKPVAAALADVERVGRPDVFPAEFWVDVLALATAQPDDSQRPITHWTHVELTDEIISRGMVETIHPTTVGRFLQEVKLQPHRVEQWMNRPDDPEFDSRASNVKDLLFGATQSDAAPSRIVVSFDEKTGMQAKERIAPDKPAKPWWPMKQEFEYRRHGTRVLFGLQVVHDGTILYRTRENRPNSVTAEVLEELFIELMDSGYERIDVILDQLNTHWSVDLVETVARLSGIPVPPAEEIQTGRQRRDWLENAEDDKAIVLHYTPKHASWLNPIEIWFGVLVRKVLRRGSFRNCEALEDRVAEFVKYYNRKLAHPYRFKRWVRAAA